MLGHARRPLGARKHCSRTRQSQLAFEIAARADDSTRKKRPSALFFRAFRSKSLLARLPLGARNHCTCVFRSHLALAIAARAGFFVFDRARKLRPNVSFSHIPVEITAQVCSAATGRSKSLLRHASKPFSARIDYSSRLHAIRQRFHFSLEVSFEIGLLRTEHCASSCALCDFISTVRCHMRI